MWMLLDEGSIRMCNVDMWMLLDEGSIIKCNVCNVDNMWMLLDEGSISVMCVMLMKVPYVNVIGWRFHKDV